MNFRFLLILFCLAVLESVHAQKIEIKSASDTFENIADYFQFFEDTARQYSLKDVSKDNFQNNFQDFNLRSQPWNKSSTYWLKLEVENKSDNEVRWILHLAHPHDASNIEIYIVNGKELVDTKLAGYNTPMRQKDMTFLSHYTRLQFPAHSHIEVYFKAQNDLDFIPLIITPIQYPEEEWNSTYSKKFLFEMLYQGALWSLMFLYLFIYMTTKDKAYIYYSIYLLLNSITNLIPDGYLQQLVPIDQNLYYLVSPLLYFSHFFYLKFVCHFIGQKTIGTKWNKAINFVTWATVIFWIVSVVLFTFIGPVIVERFYNITLLSILIFEVILSVVLLLKRNVLANFIVIGSFFLFIGFSAWVIDIIINSNYQSPYYQIGAIIEILIFALGLAYRIHANEKEKEKAQIGYIEQLKENEQLQNKMNRELEEKVKERTEEIILQKEEIVRSNTLLEERVNERLEEAYLQLESSKKDLDDFVYRSSHDLKGPLATILGLSNLGKQDVGNESHYFDKVIITTEKLKAVLDKLIFIQEAKNKIIQPEKLDIKNLLDQTIEKIAEREKILLENITWKIEIDSDIQLETDRLLIATIFENIIHNAITHSGSYKRENLIKIIVKVQTDDLISIRFIDNARKIPQKFIYKIFDMFYNANETSKGPGLGLYTAKIISKKLLATLQLNYSDDEYNEFELIIPKKYKLISF